MSSVTGERDETAKDRARNEQSWKRANKARIVTEQACVLISGCLPLDSLDYKEVLKLDPQNGPARQAVAVRAGA